MVEYALDAEKAVRYAGKWAYGRNPAYFDFDGLGGDCTNFISQCIYANEHGEVLHLDTPQRLRSEVVVSYDLGSFHALRQ